jgi:hypothetical protein
MCKSKIKNYSTQIKTGKKNTICRINSKFLFLLKKLTNDLPENFTETQWRITDGRKTIWN